MKKEIEKILSKSRFIDWFYGEDKQGKEYLKVYSSPANIDESTDQLFTLFEKSHEKAFDILLQIYKKELREKIRTNREKEMSKLGDRYVGGYNQAIVDVLKIIKGEK